MARHFVIGCGHHSFDLYSISVEPVMFIYMFSTFMSFPTLQSLIFDKVCLNKFNSTFCHEIDNRTFEMIHREEEDELQSETSLWILKANVAMAVPSLILVFFFLGSLGDMVGRKIPVLLPCIGLCLSSISNLVNSIFMLASPVYLLFGQVINGIFGGFIALLMGTYSYTAHRSTEKSRTTRLGILESMVFLAGTLGVFLSGLVLKLTSYAFVFGLISVVALVSILYVVLWLEDIKPENSVAWNAGTCCERVVESVKLSAGCVVQRRPGRMVKLALFLGVMMVLMMSTLGENDVGYLFVKEVPLGWNLTLYGYFKAFEQFSRFVFLVTFLPLAKMHFHLHDLTLALIGLFCKGVGMILFGLSQHTWMVFLVPVVTAPQGLPSAGIRSQMSGMVGKEEQGRLFSVVACLENVSQILATLLFNQLYPATLQLTPGFCFFFLAGLILLDFVIVLYLRCSGGEKYSSLQEEPCVQSPEESEPNDANEVP